MIWVDFILDLAGLLLWLNWRAGKIDPLGKRAPATLVGTLRRAEPLRLHRWHLPVVLGAFLFLRAVLYWLIGSAIGWVAKLDLGVISLPFRSDESGRFWFGRILLFSILSFLLTLGVFYSWLLLLSLLKGPKPVHDFVRLQLGRIDDWSRGVKWILPFVVTAISWWLVSWVLAWLHIIPQPASVMGRIEGSLIIASEGYLVWKFPLVALLLLHLLNNYVYFGRHPIWNYADVTSQMLLRPLKSVPFLQVGKVDLKPVVGIAAVCFAAVMAGRGLSMLSERLAF